MDDIPDERVKRKRDDDMDALSLPAPPASAGLPAPPPRLSDSPRRARERSGEPDRRYGDRPPRAVRDARDEFDDVPRYRRGEREREGPLSVAPEPKVTTPIRQVECNFAYLSSELTKRSRRPSPTYEPPPDDPLNDEPREDDSEARSVFVSQLAARLTARDLGYFFEDKLGEGSVMDSRIVTDRISRRSKGYVWLNSSLRPQANVLVHQNWLC